MKLGRKVAALRDSRGLSQHALAAMMGTSKSFVWKIEAGRTAASIDTLCKIADALGVRVADLIDF